MTNMGLPSSMVYAHDNYEESDFLSCGIENLMLKLLQTFTKTIKQVIHLDI
jgi:hypothetical protein